MHGPIDEVYRRIHGNRIVRHPVPGRASRPACPSSAAMPETRNVQVEGQHVTVELAADDQQVAALLERLVAGGARLQSFAEKEPTLEDVFMLVTKGAVA